MIKWEDRFIGDVGATCLVTVDGTNFQIYEPKPWSKKWYYRKIDGAGLHYEVAINIQMGCMYGSMVQAHVVHSMTKQSSMVD